MPDSIVTAVFVFSAVLILIALLGGSFKIFGSEIPGVSNPLIRFLAFFIGAFLLVLVLDIQAPFGINIFGDKAPTTQVSQPNSEPSGFSLPFSTPIEEVSWRDSARSVAANVGQDFKFKCPESGTISQIYGTDIYTSGSSICSAAVHAGIIDAKNGGTVKIRSLGPRDFFNATTRNDVSSRRYGSYGGSFTFFESGKPIATEQIQVLEWSDTASYVKARLGQDFEYVCPENGTIGRVTGTDIYGPGSSICSAAVHAGIISAREGGNVKIQILGPQEFFNGSDRNAVVSAKYGAYDSAFAFID